MPNIHVGCTVILAILLFPGLPVYADNRGMQIPRSIEAFTTEAQPLESIEAFLDDHPGTTVRIYLIDAIERLEAELSQGLSAQPEQAKSQALERLQRLPKSSRTQFEHAARALALAMQLGIKRYPAIVFDQQQVTYGLTNLSQAMAHYRSWQLGDKP